MRVFPGATEKFSRREWMCLALVFSVFLAQTGLYILRLGMHVDESLPALGALDLIGQLRTRPLGDVVFPLMESHCYYLGSIEVYLLLPFFWILGPGLGAARLLPVLVSLGALGCMYGVMRRWFGAPSALLAVCLLAINPCFVFATRIGLARDELLQIFFFWLFLLLLTGRRRRWTLNLAAFVFGLALWAKIMWLGYAGGLLAAGLLFNRVDLKRWLSDARGLCQALLFCAAGCFPLIVFNVLNPGATPLNLWMALFKPVNEDVRNNLLLRAWQACSMLGGVCQGVNEVFRGDNWLASLFFGLMLAALAVLALENRHVFPRRPFAFLAVAFGTMFMFAGFTPSAHQPLHLVTLLPFFAATCAVGVCSVAARWKTPWAAAALLLLTASHAGLELRVYSKVLGRVLDGRVNTFMNADVQRAVIDSIRQRAQGAPVAVYDPLFASVITFVSGRTLAVLPDWTRYTADSLCGCSFDDCWMRFYDQCLRNPARFYFLDIDELGRYGQWFTDRLQRDGRTVSRVETLVDPGLSWQCTLFLVGPAPGGAVVCPPDATKHS